MFVFHVKHFKNIESVELRETIFLVKRAGR